LWLPDSCAFVDDGQTQGQKIGQNTQHVYDVHAGLHKPEKVGKKV
jgi:hypothetical protein